jgi:hypothetical protein
VTNLCVGILRNLTGNANEILEESSENAGEGERTERVKCCRMSHKGAESQQAVSPPQNIS